MVFRVMFRVGYFYVRVLQIDLGVVSWKLAEVGEGPLPVVLLANKVRAIVLCGGTSSLQHVFFVQLRFRGSSSAVIVLWLILF